MAAASTAAFWYHSIVRWAVLLVWDRAAEGSVEGGRIVLTRTVWTIPAVWSSASSQVNKIWSAPDFVALPAAVSLRLRHVFASLNRAVACPVLLSPQTAIRAVFVYLLPSKDSSVFRALGAMAKSWKAAIGFVMSVCLHITIYLPLDGFSLNFISNIINKICTENSSLVTIRQKYQALYMKTYIRFTVISGWNIPEI